MSSFFAPKDSIQSRLLQKVSLTAAVLFCLGGLGIYCFARTMLISAFDERQEKIVEMFASGTKQTPEGEVEPEFHEWELEAFDKGETAFYELQLCQSGKIIARSPSLEAQNGADLPIRLEEKGDLSVVQFRKIILPDGIYGRSATRIFPIIMEEPDEEDLEDLTESQRQFMATYDSGAPENQAAVTVASSTAELDRFLNLLALALVVAGLIVVAAMFFIVRTVVKKSCAPIETLARATSEIDPSSAVQLRIPERPAPSELRPLIAQFNQLLTRVEATIDRERRFSADIAHELRNPVAELRTLTEVALIDLDDETPEEILRASAQIGARMSRLIEVLSALHGAGSGQEMISMSLCDPIAIFETRILALRPKSTFNRDFPPAGTISINTDPNLLMAIFDNLIRNLTDHSSKTGSITVKIRSDDDTLHFEISNPADNLETSDLGALTQPFWKKDASRTTSEHFGLGLALVKNYVDLLGGTLELTLDAEHYLHVRFTIPDSTNS